MYGEKVVYSIRYFGILHMFGLECKQSLNNYIRVGDTHML